MAGNNTSFEVFGAVMDLIIQNAASTIGNVSKENSPPTSTDSATPDSKNSPKKNNLNKKSKKQKTKNQQKINSIDTTNSGNSPVYAGVGYVMDKSTGEVYSPSIQNSESNYETQYEKPNLNNFKKFLQGGNMQQEQQELQLALMGYIVATKKQPKDENEINQLAQALVQLKQQDPKQFAQLVQLGQQAQALKAEQGAKLNYIKSLKGQCPDGEELVYFKKGGMIDCGCQKKEKGGEVKQPKKANVIEEFKKGRKTKKC